MKQFLKNNYFQKRMSYFFLFCSLMPMIAISPFCYAHSGGFKLKGEHNTVIKLSPQRQSAIDLKTVIAEFRHIPVYLRLNGEVQVLPDQQADVRTRISGHILALYANLGDVVSKGQKLLKVQSRISGDPPPSVLITAPISGVIEACDVKLGQSIEPNTELFQISNRKKMLVLASVYEEDLSKVNIGQTVSIKTISYPNKTFTGKVTLIEPNLDAFTRTIKIWIEVANPQRLLKPNMFVNANLLLHEKQEYLAIPNAAIIETSGRKFVFVKEEEKFHRVDVKTGITNHVYTEITDGLVPEDEVVTQGNRQIYTLWLTGGETSEEGH